MRVLASSRLHFRRVTADDIDRIATLHGDPEVMRFITGGVAEPRSVVAEKTLPRWLVHHAAPPPVGFWAAFEGDVSVEEAFVGWFMLRPDREVADALEVGYRLHRAAWGRGLATEGAQAFVRWAFEQTDILFVTGQALAANVASRRVLAKAGLLFERNFVYPASVLPGWPLSQRAGVRYRRTRADHEASAAQKSGRKT